jgi:capsular exopolysaccharide synthesis family protein
MNNNQINQQQAFVEEDTIDIKKLLLTVRKGWYFFVTFPLITAIVAFLYLRYTIPAYEVKGSILIKNEESAGLSTDMLSEELLGFSSSSEVIDESRILQSRSIMQQVVKDLGLNVAVLKDGRVKDTGLYKNSPIEVDSFFFSETLVKKNIQGIEFKLKIIDGSNFSLIYGEQEYKGKFGTKHSNDLGEFYFRFNPSAEIDEDGYILRLTSVFSATLAYQTKLRVNQDDLSSNILILAMEDAIPERSIDIINKVIEVYNIEAIEDKNATGENTLEFIDERIDLLTGQLTDVEKGVQAYKEENGIATDAASNVGVIIEQMSDYNLQLDQLEIRRTILTYLEDYVNDKNKKYELIPSNIGAESGMLSALVLRLNDIIQQRKRLLQTITLDHPSVIVLDDEIASLRFNIKENIKNIKRDIEISLQKLKTRSAEFETQLNKTPRKERELLEIKRQQYVKENLFLFLLQKREETAISLAAMSSNARVIDVASLSSTQAVSPKKSPILAGAVFLGLILAIVIILLKEFLVDTIQSEEDIRSETQVPLLGVIAESMKDARVVVTKSSRSAIAEMFRLLRTNLQFTLAGEPHKTMLVTSTISGEGKSFTCINLGMSFALSGQKVLVIGLDLRKPKMASYLVGTVPAKGISSYMIDAATKDEIINVYEGDDNLHFIASGPIPPNPSELIMNGRLGSLIEELKQEYDVIIIDTPPVGFVTDSLLLKSMVNASIYVSRFNYTKKGQLQLIDKLYREGKFNNPTIVLNGVKRGKGYGYGYGYYEDEK